VKSVPIWLWPNVLSLDAPVIAIAWQALLSQTTGTPLRTAGRVILFLTVWLIYIVDRLFDARHPATSPEPPRHQFYRQHRSGSTILAMVILVVDTVLILFELHPAVFHSGLLAFAGVCLYFGLLHGLAVPFPKEAAVALLFTIGTFLVAFTRTERPAVELLAPAAAFFLLCLANLAAIEYWEAAPHLLLGRWYGVWVPALAVAAFFALPGRWGWAISLSALALTALFGFGSKLSLSLRRALVDAALVVPPLLFQ
jgi:hypothetical protein